MPMTVSLTPEERQMLQQLTAREFPGRERGMMSTMLGKLIRDAYDDRFKQKERDNGEP